MARRIAVIVNPAAGQDRPVLGILNSVFHPAAVDWEVFVTKKPGDARRSAQAAAVAGFDVVAVYGGDGTVAEAAAGLIGTRVPLALLPGGTANVLSVELGISSDLPQAAALACGPLSHVRPVDMARTDDGYFILRAGIGFEAAMVKGADREQKDRLGSLAYALAALQALREPAIARYSITLDGHPIATEGITCIVANSGSFGRTGLALAPTIDVGDGLLDVVVVRKADLASLLAVAASVLTGQEQAEPLQHWQARDVTIVADPPQTLTLDGEMRGQTPLRAQVVPGAVRVVVPAATPPGILPARAPSK